MRFRIVSENCVDGKRVLESINSYQTRTEITNTNIYSTLKRHEGDGGRIIDTKATTTAKNQTAIYLYIRVFQKKNHRKRGVFSVVFPPYCSTIINRPTNRPSTVGLVRRADFVPPNHFRQNIIETNVRRRFSNIPGCCRI